MQLLGVYEEKCKAQPAWNIPAATAFAAANCHRVTMEASPEVLGCELLLYILAALLVRWFSGKTLVRDQFKFLFPSIAYADTPFDN